MKEIISRPLYQEKIKKYRYNGYIKVFTGQRRVGKSVLLQQTLQTYENSFLLDMEYMYHKVIQSDDKLYAYLSEKLEENTLDAVGIDEIQLIAGRERVMISLNKEYPDVDFYVTGSNSTMLSSELTTRLRGRYVQIHIYPFGYSEYLNYHNLQVKRDTYIDYLKQGGFPSLYGLEPTQQREWAKQLIHTIFFRDVIERHNIRHASLLEDLFRFVVDNVTSYTSMDSIRKKLKQEGVSVTVVTLQEYMKYLADSYLVYPVELYDIQGKRIFERKKKWYPSDHNWRYALLGMYNDGLGQLCEIQINFALLRYGREVTVGRIGAHEIDFVATKDTKKLYIQVAYLLDNKETIAREFGSLEKINDNYPKYVVSTDDISLGEKNGIIHMPIWEFIEKVVRG